MNRVCRVRQMIRSYEPPGFAVSELRPRSDVAECPHCAGMRRHRGEPEYRAERALHVASKSLPRAALPAKTWPYLCRRALRAASSEALHSRYPEPPGLATVSARCRNVSASERFPCAASARASPTKARRLLVWSRPVGPSAIASALRKHCSAARAW